MSKLPAIAAALFTHTAERVVRVGNISRTGGAEAQLHRIADMLATWGLRVRLLAANVDL